MKRIKSFKKFVEDEDETVFSGPGEEESLKKAKIIKKLQKSLPGADKAPPMGINGTANYTNRTPAPLISRGYRKSKV